MFLRRLWKHLSPFTCLQQARALHGIYSAGEFRQVLDRERARADRNEHEFSLVVFDGGNTDTNDALVRRLVHALVRRVRSTDEIGWFDEQHIGVILPYTPANGAWKLADDICQMIAATASPPVCTVYTYPSQWLPGGNRHSQRRRFADVSPEADSAVLRDLSLSTRSTVGDGTASARQTTATHTRTRTRSADGLELLFARRMPAWKRGMDIVGSLLGLILLSPLLLLTAIVIKMVSPGPVFLKQERMGHLGKLFTLWKFRTMKVNADNSLHRQHLSNLINEEKPMTKLDFNRDPRIIPFGKILRQSGLDELPQLINVLRGEMSLVGPRPCFPYEAQEYLRWQTRRFDVVPGMTGLWQVSGKNRTTFKEMLRLDIAYARQRSFWLEVKILLKTFPAIITEIIHGFIGRKKVEEMQKVITY